MASPDKPIETGMSLINMIDAVMFPSVIPATKQKRSSERLTFFLIICTLNKEMQRI
jgi:hypothetical protein